LADPDRACVTAVRRGETDVVVVPPGRVDLEDDLRSIRGIVALELPGRSVVLENAARLAAGRRDHPQRAILDAREEDLLSVRRPAGVGGPKVVARKPPGPATRGGNAPDRPTAGVHGPDERPAAAAGREGRGT